MADRSSKPICAQNLPPEILEIIFQHLNSRDLGSCSQTCQKWHQVIENQLKNKCKLENEVYFLFCTVRCEEITEFQSDFHQKFREINYVNSYFLFSKNFDFYWTTVQQGTKIRSFRFDQSKVRI